MENITVSMKRFRRGISLVETLLAVAVVAIIAAGGYLAISDLREGAAGRKLERDVLMLNSAVRTYRLSGGAPLADVASVGELLARLKTSATAATANKVVGFRGTLVDLRLKAEEIPAGAGGKTGKRAVWDAGTEKLTIVENATAGVRKFYSDDSLDGVVVGATEDRKTAMEYALNDPWVWDYDDVEGAASSDGTRIEGGVGYAGPGGLPPGNPTKLVLNPPNFSEVGGDRPITEYDFPVVLSDPNPTGTSIIYYTVTEDGVTTPELYYDGGPILVSPDDEIMGVCRSIDPDHWEDSGARTEIYTGIPLTLVIDLALTKAGFTYAELGGPLMPGNYDEYLATEPGNVTLTNLAEIPARYLKSSNFRILATRDGSDPLGSATAMAGPEFDGVFPVHLVGLSLDDYGANDYATVSAIAKSFEPTMFVTSAPATVVPGRLVTPLPVPLVQPGGGVTRGVDDNVTLSPDVDTGRIPVGARLVYTLDGTEPGFDARGGLLPGTFLYGGSPLYPFDRGGFAVEVRSRLVGSVSYNDWFVPSLTTSDTYNYVINPSGTLWAIDTGGGGSLLEVRNYNNPERGFVVDWGQILFDNGSGTNAPLADPIAATGPGVAAMTITATGMGYLVRNLPTELPDGSVAARALLSLDIGSLKVGDTPVATLVGDLQAGLENAVAADAGGLVTGMGVSGDGKLFVAIGRGTGITPGVSDTLVRIDSLETDAGGQITQVALVGNLTGETGKSTETGDLAFAPDGTLYVSDRADGEVYAVDPDTAAIASLYGKQTGTEYAALAFNHNGGGDFVASSVRGSTYSDTFVGITAGSDTDTSYFSYAERGGYSEIEAMGFFTSPFVPSGPAPVGTLYAVAEGSRNLYKFDPTTGTHTILASGAPFDLNSLGHDEDKDILYFIEDVDTNFRLGKYTIGTATFETIASLTTPSDPPFVDPITGISTPAKYDYTPSARPDNLVFWCDSLWYIASGSDDLIRIEFRKDGSIKKQRKVADMGDDQLLYNFGNVGDIAANSEGNLLFSDAYGTLYSYHIPSLSGLGIVATDFQPLSAIVLDEVGAYYGVPSNPESGHRIYAINGVIGVSAFAANTIPTIRFTDFAYGHAGSGNREVVPASIDALGYYSTVVFEQYESNSDVGGHMLIGAQLKGSKSFSYGTDLSGKIPPSEVLMKVGGEIDGGNAMNIDAGSVEIGLTRGNRVINMNSGGTITENVPFDITDTRVALEAAAVGYSELAPNGTVTIPTNQAGQLTFNSGAASGGVAVFHVRGDDVFNNPKVQQIDLEMNGAVAAIINISGTRNINWNHGNLVGYLGSNEATTTVLWNFYEASVVDLKGNRMKGAILAPFAYFTHHNHIDGSFVAQSAFSNGTINRHPLRTDLYPDPSGVPYTDFCLDDTYGPGLQLPPDGVPKPGSYVAGVFTRADGTGRNIARLKNDGTLDEGFNPGQGASVASSVLVIFEQDDERLLIGGDFATMSGAPIKGVARMAPDGAIDASFDAALQ